ncbi:MAG: hypothetical protein Q9222_004654 [Ikaeria aurantiellina]
MTYQIDRLHIIYGSIVRISPWEVHVQDPDFLHFILSNEASLDRDTWYYGFAGCPSSSLATGSVKLHKTRRDAINRLFSRASVLRSVNIIEDRVGDFLGRLDEHRIAGTEVKLSQAFRCLGFDIVSDYALPNSQNTLRDEEFAPWLSLTLRTLRYVSLWNRHLGFLVPLLLWIPHWVRAFLVQKKILLVAKFQEDVKSQATEVFTSGGSSWAPRSYPSLLHTIVNSQLPPSERSIERVTQEAVTIVGAGLEATTNVLSVIVFEVLKDPHGTARLKKELATVNEDPSALLKYKQIAELPYLSAVIREGLRLAKENGRLPRINPTSSTTYRQYQLPAGTVMSASVKDMHRSEAIFKDALAFNPERWMDTEKAKHLQHFILPFSKGQRVCVGQHIAWVELFVILANLIHRSDLQLWETTEQDVDSCHNYFAPNQSTQAEGVKVLVH